MAKQRDQLPGMPFAKAVEPGDSTVLPKLRSIASEVFGVRFRDVEPVVCAVPVCECDYLKLNLVLESDPSKALALVYNVYDMEFVIEDSDGWSSAGGKAEALGHRVAKAFDEIERAELLGIVAHEKAHQLAAVDWTTLALPKEWREHLAGMLRRQKRVAFKALFPWAPGLRLILGQDDVEVVDSYGCELERSSSEVALSFRWPVKDGSGREALSLVYEPKSDQIQTSQVRSTAFPEGAEAMALLGRVFPGYREIFLEREAATRAVVSHCC